MTGTGRAMTKTPEREQMPPINLPKLVLGTMSPYLECNNKTTTSLLSREKWTKKQVAKASNSSGKTTTIRLVTLCTQSLYTPAKESKPKPDE